MTHWPRPIRLLVVDDSKFTRQVFKRVFRDEPRVEIVGEGRNGREAVELNLELEPDVITLDIDMPEMGGLEALERIMQSRPCPVIMVSSHTREQSELAFLALEKGAVDFVDKNVVENTLELRQLGDILLSKVMAVAGAVPEIPAQETSLDQSPEYAPGREPERVWIIGASTGGPPLVQSFVKAIPIGHPDAFVVVQHMPKGFTASFAARLARVAQVPVQEVNESMRMEAGSVYIAKAGMQLEVRDLKEGPHLVLRADVEGYPFAPSIDLAVSTSAVLGPRAVTLILTGMGDDGSRGAGLVEKAGGVVYIQEPSTAVLPSMPSASLAVLARPRILRPADFRKVLAP